MSDCKKANCFFMLIWLVVFSGCEGEDTSSSPKLVIETSEQYSAMEYPGDTKTFVFQLSNKGRGVLEILGIKKSCGCVSLDLANMRIQAEESEALTLTVSQDRYGMVSQWVVLRTNEPNDLALHRLKVTTEITPRIVFTPSQISEELYTDETRQRLIEVTMHVDGNIVRAEKSASWITSLVCKDNDITVRISAMDLKEGDYKDSIRITTDIDREPELAIPVSLTVKPEVSVIPDFLSLGVMKKNSKKNSRLVRVSVSGQCPKNMELAIEPEELLSYHVKADLSENVIYVSLKDFQFVGEIDGRLVIRIKGTNEISVPVKGYVY